MFEPGLVVSGVARQKAGCVAASHFATLPMPSHFGHRIGSPNQSEPVPLHRVHFLVFVAVAFVMSMSVSIDQIKT